MRLAEHCQAVLGLIQADLAVGQPDLPGDDLIEMIREKIDQRAITTNVLRTYAAICYFLGYGKTGVTQEQLNQIPTYEDQVTEKDVTYCLGRLMDGRIIKKRSEYFLRDAT